jgi:anaerobic magnesium-protoporphyrin IX monomethyl ester cyclase
VKVALIVPYTPQSGNVARDLVYGCWCKGGRIGGASFPPMPLLHVGGVLAERGHQLVLLDAQAERLPLVQAQERIKNCSAAIILTSTTTLNDDCAYLAPFKQANPGLTVIAFGGHVTAEPCSSLLGGQRQGIIDIIVRREAEWIIMEVVDALAQGGDSWKSVRGISYLEEDGSCISNEDYPLCEDLDRLPIPDRKQLHPELYFNPFVLRMPFTTMFTSRGCPGRCIFCASPYFYGRVERAQSPARVLEEIEVCVRQGYRENAWPPYAREFCNANLTSPGYAPLELPMSNRIS